jgi:hypothetical protein
MVSSIPLGFGAAMGVLECGRAAFFGSESADLPKRSQPAIMSDDLVPQFGYVGPQYPATRVLMLGINPGNGPDKIRSASDELLLGALRRFVADRTVESFLEAQRAYRQVCRSWPVWKRHCAAVIGAGKLSLDDIAYSNCLPWRTASEAAFADSVAERAARLYAYPLIDELQPRIVVALGKKAARILSLGDRTMTELVVWNRAQAATRAVLEEREATGALILARLARQAT